MCDEGCDHLTIYINIIPLCCIPETNVMSWPKHMTKSTWRNESHRIEDIRILTWLRFTSFDRCTFMVCELRVGYGWFSQNKASYFVEWVSASWWGLIPCSWSWLCRPQSHYRPCNWWIVISSLEGWRLHDSKTVAPDYTPRTQHRALKGRSFIHGWKTWTELSH